jgi:transposase
VIPEPDDQKAHRNRIGSSGGRPVTYDRTAYRGRNIIERAFNGFNHWRGLATRYDKHAIVYCGGLVLAAVLLWLTDLAVEDMEEVVPAVGLLYEVEVEGWD